MHRMLIVSSQVPSQLFSQAEGSAARQLLGDWYDRARRDLPWRRSRDPYAIWVSEVMLQQTQVRTVIPYYERFMQLFPSIRHLARADEQALLKAWEGLGYYSRVRNMQRAAQMIMENHGAVPAESAQIRSLPGIGPYIAAAVLSIAYSQPYAVVDGNVKRVLARLLCMDSPVNDSAGHAAFQAAADAFLDRADPGRHNQAMMELGALVCTPRLPLCPECPLAHSCCASQTETFDRYPRRAPRRTVGEQTWAAAVVVKKGKLLLTQRPPQGLLAGMWEFPSVLLCKGEDPAQACLAYARASLGLGIRTQQHVASVRHAYTHFRLRLELYLCLWHSGRVRLEGPRAFQWISPDRIETFPLHRAVHKALPAILQSLPKSGA